MGTALVWVFLFAGAAIRRDFLKKKTQSTGNGVDRSGQRPKEHHGW
jgi:hypothetical protein